MTASPASSSAATTRPAPGRWMPTAGRCMQWCPAASRSASMAYRFGVNLVMYALTGNYKTDQVHVPAILERLGTMSGFSGYSLATSPLLPWWAIAGFAAAAALRARASARLAARARHALAACSRCAMLLLILLDPVARRGAARAQRDVAVVVVDDIAEHAHRRAPADTPPTRSTA